MLADEPEPGMPNGYRAAGEAGDTTFAFVMYVDDVDAAFARALEHGATALSAPETQFYGDREARLRDPFGYD